jgi:hypothetical protein
MYIPGRPSADWPSFWEFVQYLFLRKYFDEHWSPIYSFCSLCVFDFDYILKFENYESEVSSFLAVTNLTNYLPKTAETLHFNVNRPEELSRYLKKYNLIFFSFKKQ